MAYKMVLIFFDVGSSSSLSSQHLIYDPGTDFSKIPERFFLIGFSSNQYEMFLEEMALFYLILSSPIPRPFPLKRNICRSFPHPYSTSKFQPLTLLAAAAVPTF